MRSVRRTVAVVCMLALGGCTTEPYKESIGTFAKGVAASQSSLAKLDGRNTDIARRIQIRTQAKNLRVGPCIAGQGCEFVGLTPPKSSIPNALLYMAQLVAYSNGLAELAAAKDTDAIQKAVGKINSAAKSGIKSFGSQVRQSATIVASLDLVGLVATEIIEDQRVEALRKAIISNQRRVENAIVSLSDTSFQLQNIVIGIERSYLAEQVSALQQSTDTAEQVRLANEISSMQENLNDLAKTDARVPFRALLKAHRAVVRAARDPNYSFTDAAGLVLDFLEKAQVLDAAIKKGA